jgi:hypothetical protein
MKSNRAVFAACAAWAAVALSSATRAEATVVTQQTGGFALCSSNSEAFLTYVLCGPDDTPDEMPYRQTIKFQGTACNAGGCLPGDTSVKSDMIYPVGRVTATLIGTCGTKRFYNLATCAC